MENPDFDNLKHLQNSGHLSLTKYSMFSSRDNIGTAYGNKNIIETDHNNDQQPMDVVL